MRAETSSVLAMTRYIDSTGAQRRARAARYDAACRVHLLELIEYARAEGDEAETTRLCAVYQRAYGVGE